jgi:FMN phosphatase YigB (HAD superfamily)
MTSPIKVIAFDLDDTLLNTSKFLYDRDVIFKQIALRVEL